MQTPGNAGRPQPEAQAKHAERHGDGEHPDHQNSGGNEGYEVVCAETEDVDEESGPETPRHPKNGNAQPSLPRLNSQSRAPSSRLGAETEETEESEQQPETPSRCSTPADSETPRQGSESKEVPESSEATNGSAPDDEPQESADSQRDDQSEETGRVLPATARSSLKEKTDSDEKNPTIQIPKVTSVASGLSLPPNLAQLAEGLEGKYVDEFGNILDWDGRVLGRVEGDLPSMIGKPVSATGEVLNDGKVVGYVAENDTIPPRPPSPKPIQGMGAGLKVDHLGNILDDDNNVVGHFNQEALAPPEEKERRSDEPEAKSPPSSEKARCQCHTKSSKPYAAPSPSEIYLDVKSTNDGVQLIIKIPTVFNGGRDPQIHVSTG